jgi:hypothetical protein
MATYYIAPQTGSNSNAGTSESLPRATPPTAADGDVWLFKRGETFTSLVQVSTAAATNMTLGAYGTGEMPIITIKAPNVNALNIQGDGTHFIRDLWFKDCTTNTNGGVVGLGTVAASGRGASAEITDCKFTGCNWNAIRAAGTTTANSALRIVVRDCVFDDIGEDGIYGPALHFEFGRNRLTNISSKSTTGDGVGFIGADPTLAWVYDNYIDHSSVDSKHCIIIDTATGAGHAVIENNTLIGFGTETTVSTDNVGINCECPAVIRGNYIRSGRIAAAMFGASSSFTGNVVDVVNAPTTTAIIAMSASSIRVTNNTIRSRITLPATQKAVVQASGASSCVVQNNVFQNLQIAIRSDNAANNPTATYNCFWQVTTPRQDQAGAAFAGGNDITADPLLYSDGSIPNTSPCRTAGTYVSGVTLANGRLRPNFTPIGAYMAVLPRTARV